MAYMKIFPRGFVAALRDVYAAVYTGDVPSGAVVVIPQQTKTHLSDAQIAALHTTRVAGVPAPGAGKMLQCLGLSGGLTFNGQAFSGGGGLKVVYGLAGTHRVAASNGNLISSTEDSSFFGYTDTSGLTLPRAQMENQPLCFFLDSPANSETGPLVVLELVSGGANYVVGGTLSINGGFSNGIIEIDSVDGGGAILTWHIVQTGSDYSVTNGAETTPLDLTPGSGATFDIIEVDAAPDGDSEIDATLVYSIVDAP